MLVRMFVTWLHSRENARELLNFWAGCTVVHCGIPSIHFPIPLDWFKFSQHLLNIVPATIQHVTSGNFFLSDSWTTPVPRRTTSFSILTYVLSLCKANHTSLSYLPADCLKVFGLFVGHLSWVPSVTIWRRAWKFESECSWKHLPYLYLLLEILAYYKNNIHRVVTWLQTSRRNDGYERTNYWSF